MLALEEAGLSLSIFKILSILNILPIGVDVENGKIEKQSSKIRVFIWKFFFGVGISRSFYVFGRLIQSILEPMKYFRWDHFILHFGLNLFWAVFYFTGFRLFAKNAEENQIIFNQLFEEREDPVQKMMDRQIQRNSKSRNGNEKRVCGISAWENETRAKTEARRLTASAPDLHEDIEMEVIENRSKTESESAVQARPLLTWPPKYSMDELVAKLFAVLLVPTAFFTLLILAVDPTRPQLLYSSLPPEWQNVWSFSILLAIEALCTAIPIFTCSFSLVTQVLLFGKCQLEFQRLSLQLGNLREKFQNQPLGIGIGSRDIGREIWILRQISKEMRELVVLIELFNRCFPFVIFPFKICALSLCIMFYFFFIRHFEDFPILAAFLCYIAIAHTLTYIIMYTRAFSIPGKMDELKNEFLLTAQKTTSNSNEKKNLWAEMKREIKRICSIGIKVGSFHQMERESTPNFINFVFNHVVSLLVTFPR